MKKPTFDGLALSELLYSSGQEQKTGSKLANPTQKSKPLKSVIPLPSLGKHVQDAYNLAVLLQNMQSGMDAYHEVYDNLWLMYGAKFKKQFLKEVHNG